MMTEDKLFIVAQNNTTDYNLWDCLEIFKELELAKQMLKNLYKSTIDLTSYNYEIRVYRFDGKKYQLTDETYSYRLDKFTKHS